MGKQAMIALLFVFSFIGIVFLLFGAYWYFLMNDYKEIIKLDTTGFSKDLVSVIQSFFITMGLVFLLGGVILYLYTYEYEWG